MQRYWLELIAGLDYMQIHQPVMNGKVQCDETFDFNCLIGVFTLSLDVAKQHMKAGIPVYLIRPIKQFTNQIILKAEQPTVFNVNKTLPQPSFPVVFSGDPSHPKKFDAMHRFMQIFHMYRNPFNFSTVSSTPSAIPSTSACPSPSIPPSTSGAPVCNQRSKTQASGPLGKGSLQRSKTENLQSTRDKFADLSGRYTPPTVPAWAGANAKIDKDSECSQEHEAQAQRIQSWHDANGEKKDYNINMGYAFPNPGLFVYASATQQSTYFRQWEHYQDTFIYRVASSTSNATPIHLQVWRELLAMPFKKEHTKTIKAHDTMLDMMGTALQMSKPDLKCQSAILNLFLVESLIPLPSCSVTSSVSLHSMNWKERCIALEAFRKIMSEWEVPLVFEAKGLLDPSGDEVSLKVEKTLVKHYVQTFFDYFGRPPVLPYMPPQHAPINQPEELEREINC
ncbi:hypothetical protein F5146DRAFT_1004107 [Armillaria mellea]|nr:hypothetical protein F5146DRAFT_1004107 [Armillaria mellea]